MSKVIRTGDGPRLINTGAGTVGPLKGTPVHPSWEAQGGLTKMYMVAMTYHISEFKQGAMAAVHEIVNGRLALARYSEADSAWQRGWNYSIDHYL